MFLLPGGWPLRCPALPSWSQCFATAASATWTKVSAPMSDKTKHDITTKLVHGGERRGVPEGRPVATPIYASATFTYDSMQEIDQVFGGEKQGFIYTRYGNPTI